MIPEFFFRLLHPVYVGSFEQVAFGVVFWLVTVLVVAKTFALWRER